VLLSFLLYYAKSSISTDANIITALSKITLNCKNKDTAMNVKSVMSFGLEMVGFGAKRQNVRDNLSIRRFRSHFGIGPAVIVAIIVDTKNDIELKHLMTLCWLKLYETEHVMSGRWGHGEEVCRDNVKHIASRLKHLNQRRSNLARLIKENVFGHC
jgi:hypothetical protein